MVRHILISLVLLVFAITGCNKDEGYNYSEYKEYESANDYALSIPATSIPPPPPPKIYSDGSIKRKIIKTGQIEIESNDVSEDYNELKILLKNTSAYIESEDQYRSDQEISYTIKIRVPSENYDTLFNSMVKGADRLIRKQSNIEDVTEQYYDLKTRIKNQKALEERYLQILKNASKVSDILEIESKLTEVRSEIETLEGKFKYLSKQISFSSITLLMVEELSYNHIPEKNTGFGEKLLGSFDNGWSIFLSFVVGVFRFWPFWIILIISFILFKRYRKRRKNGLSKA
ncbi:DUF4349 domain-containing protein [Mangrovivirga sp. M17]|uniref:DUF4349 domain-containing protein n=1 Tax=Mangrovivirga halotolerans TaxID=2993936 RepID=A0ABT3RM84_9BACT|nr:DUF4349 domain-containing protein [Mangrovivirga halotolerans]MCX2742665.1 DUF4349 domain-containing protein [Mangrovivirga halotolerans]